MSYTIPENIKKKYPNFKILSDEEIRNYSGRDPITQEELDDPNSDGIGTNFWWLRENFPEELCKIGYEIIRAIDETIISDESPEDYSVEVKTVEQSNLLDSIMHFLDKYIN